MRGLHLAVSAPDDEIVRWVLSFALECAGRIDKRSSSVVTRSRSVRAIPLPHGDLAELYDLRGQINEAPHEADESFRLGSPDVTVWRQYDCLGQIR